MKIAIITFHNSSNFGATLQCLALSEYLKGLGHDVRIINYLPGYVRNKKGAFKELEKVNSASNKGKALIKGLAYLCHYPLIKRRDDCFERFINEHLELTSAYHTQEQLRQDPPAADLYICGSDQIWNPALTGGTLDGAFFLQFASDRKAAYGVSVGEYDFSANAETLRKLTCDFIGVSVRERYIAGQLAQAIGRRVNTVLDCTLLPDRTFYERFESPVAVNNVPYLLFYTLQRSQSAEKIARDISKEEGLSIVDISPNPFIHIEGGKKLMGIGPGEFLTLVKNASYIVTNSYHGTLFSIIYRRRFISIPHSTRGGRTADFLKMAGLEDRLVDSYRAVDRSQIDYAVVEHTLEQYKTESRQYIDMILNPETDTCSSF